jgi:DnaJ-class molecular chaperone
MKITRTASGKKTIKMSKSEWERIGKKAGWLIGSKKENPEGKEECPECHGEGGARYRSTSDPDESDWDVCRCCDGSGYITEEEYDKYYKGWQE